MVQDKEILKTCTYKKTNLHKKLLKNGRLDDDKSEISEILKSYLER